jgi:endogenous inhibitor of DNA gyrase (YacG/DUF329 family)
MNCVHCGLGFILVIARKDRKFCSAKCRTRAWQVAHPGYSISRYQTQKNTDKLRKYRQTATGKAAVAKAVRRYESKNPHRRLAWNKAAKLPKKPCEKCGTNNKVHKHHPDPAHPLTVIYLCPLHHKQADKAL